jgi:hypothetical protein
MYYNIEHKVLNFNVKYSFTLLLKIRKITRCPNVKFSTSKLLDLLGPSQMLLHIFIMKSAHIHEVAQKHHRYSNVLVFKAGVKCLRSHAPKRERKKEEDLVHGLPF